MKTNTQTHTNCLLLLLFSVVGCVFLFTLIEAFHTYCKTHRQRKRGGCPRKRRNKKQYVISQIVTLNRAELYSCYSKYTTIIQGKYSINQSINQLSRYNIQEEARYSPGLALVLFLVEQQTKSARKLGKFEQKVLKIRDKFGFFWATFCISFGFKKEQGGNRLKVGKVVRAKRWVFVSLLLSLLLLIFCTQTTKD